MKDLRRTRWGRRMVAGLVSLMAVGGIAVTIANRTDDEGEIRATKSQQSTSTTVATTISSNVAPTLSTATSAATTPLEPTVAEILDGLRNPTVGQTTTYIRGAFNVRDGAVVRDDIGPGAAVTDRAGLLMSPELVTVDGVAYAVGTENGHNPDPLKGRELRVVPVSDLAGADGPTITNDIVTSQIARFDVSGDAYTDDAPPPGRDRYEDGSIVRWFVNESDDVVTTVAADG